MLGRNLILSLLAVVGLISIIATSGGSLNSGGDQTGAGTTLQNATELSITNCLTCHSSFNAVLQQYLVSRHGNHMLSAARVANDVDETLSDDPRPTSCSTGLCHDPSGDGAIIDGLLMQQALTTLGNDTNIDWSTGAAIIGCEACHGGGQFHNGIAAGIPYPVPGPEQCGLCHYLNDTLAQNGLYGSVPVFHDQAGDNVRRNISDTHIDDPATTDEIEGYVVKTDSADGCSSCHVAHAFDLTINYQWGRSAHGGQIKTVKDTALAAGLPVPFPDGAAERLALLTSVTAAVVSSTSGDGWVHYDWDAGNRQSCQRCHTSTGLMNFLADTANYDRTANDYTHLSGWSKAGDGTVTSSGQNEMLYCWGCHSNTQTGALRDDANGITLDFVWEDPTGPSGVQVSVVLPDKGKSNVCGTCHAGRGNNTSIRTGNRSSRFAGHHAPTAGSVYATTTHTGYEYENPAGTPLDYTNASFKHDSANSPVGSGPCASCHMGSSMNHTFSATTYVSGAITHQDSSDPIATIRNLATCNAAFCHDGAPEPAMSAVALQAFKVGYEAATAVLTAYMNNSTVNYLGLDISTTSNNNYRTVELNAYGAFQNFKYMTEEPCAYVHNSLYIKRLIFDSIDWMADGTLDGTVDLTGSAAAAAYLNGGAPANIAAVPRPTP